jgi:hypothetical protein
VVEREETLRDALGFDVRAVADPTLERGRQVVERAGQPGEVANTYRLTIVDGVEADRVLVRSVVLVAPVEEIRRVGARVPTVPAAVPTNIEGIIRDAAARYGADPDQLLRVAWCESRYNPNAYNPSGAAGLFQFMPRTWAANSARVGLAGASPFDPVAAANVAAWMFARGAAAQWSCK